MPSDEDAIGALNGEFVASANEGNIDRWIDVFTEDAVMMGPDMPILEGKQAIYDTIKAGFFDPFDLTLDNSIVDLEIADGWAHGRLTSKFIGVPKDGGDTINANAKLTSIFRKQDDGAWKWELFTFSWDAPFGS